MAVVVWKTWYEKQRTAVMVWRTWCEKQPVQSWLGRCGVRSNERLSRFGGCGARSNQSSHGLEDVVWEATSPIMVWRTWCEKQQKAVPSECSETCALNYHNTTLPFGHLLRCPYLSMSAYHPLYLLPVTGVHACSYSLKCSNNVKCSMLHLKWFQGCPD